MVIFILLQITAYLSYCQVQPQLNSTQSQLKLLSSALLNSRLFLLFILRIELAVTVALHKEIKDEMI